MRLTPTPRYLRAVGFACLMVTLLGTATDGLLGSPPLIDSRRGGIRPRNLPPAKFAVAEAVPVAASSLNLGRGLRLRSTKVQMDVQTGSARALSLASGDYNEDGMPDLVVGYQGGTIVLKFGNVDSVFPNTHEARIRRHVSALSGSNIVPAPFLSSGGTFALPEDPDFIGSGDFDGDGHVDVVAAARDGERLYLLRGAGDGQLAPAAHTDVGARITALTTGQVHRPDPVTDIAVGVVGAGGPRALIFESPDGALTRLPQSLTLPAPARSLAVGHLDANYSASDLAVAAGANLFIVHGRDRWRSHDNANRANRGAADVTRLALPYSVDSLAVGDFSLTDHLDLGLLSDDGTVHVVSAALVNAGGGQGSQGVASLDSLEWQEVTLGAGPADATGLVGVRLTGQVGDDLAFVDPSDRALQVLTGTKGPQVTAGRGRVEFGAGAYDQPSKVLPMRLDHDALTDFVVLSANTSELTVFLTADESVSTVNSSGDGSDCDPMDGICLIGAKDPETKQCPAVQICTLAAAIQQANAGGPTTINFAVSSVSPSTLPAIQAAVTIDGGGTLLTGLGASLVLSGGPSVVRDLVVNQGAGLFLASSGHIIEGNLIGPDGTGTIAAGGSGIQVSGSRNRIGGTTTAARNVISGNGEFVNAVDISGDANIVEGNFIGVDSTGTRPLGNFVGVQINSGSGNVVGGSAASRNIIAASFAGVRVFGLFGPAVGNIVRGNFIGTDVSGSVGLGHRSGAALFVSVASNTTVAANVISGNQVAGAAFQLDSGSLFEGNLVGTDGTGFRALPNLHGIQTDRSEILIARNVVSGNVDDGMILADFGPGVRVESNFIGTAIDGTSPLPNGNGGVGIAFGVGTIVGGTATGAGNVIAFNGRTGVWVSDGTGNTIRGNSIHSNGRIGIELGSRFGGDVTANDIGDLDTGPNDLQNFPVLTAVSSTASSTTVTGTLNSTPDSSFIIEFFSNAACGASGHGEGESLLGSTAVTTDGAGNAAFTVTLPAARVVTATATDGVGSTSEFSTCGEATASADLSMSKIAVDSITGQPLTAVFTDSTFVYALRVENSGPATATRVVLTDFLAAGVLYQSDNCGGRTTGQAWTADVASLAPSQSIECRITVEVASDAAGPIANAADVSSAVPDPNALNNSASVVLDVLRLLPDLEIDARLFGNAELIVEVRNNGAAGTSPQSVLARIQVPVHLRVSGVSHAGCNVPSPAVPFAPTAVLCDLGPMGPDSSVVIRIRIQMPPAPCPNPQTVRVADMAFVDPHKGITESNESNNTSQQDFEYEVCVPIGLPVPEGIPPGPPHGVPPGPPVRVP